MPNNETFVGTPSAMFVPAGKHSIEFLSGLASFTIPVRGTFGEGSPRPGEPYDIVPKEGVFLFGTLVEVMFAEQMYPALDKDQRFVMSGFEVNGNAITVVGRVAKVSLSEG